MKADRSGAAARDPLYSRIHDLVRQIPSGRVATYGQIARIVGCTARIAGYAMAAVPDGAGVPWHRVVNSQGRVSPRAEGGESRQVTLLVGEGVLFDARGRIDLAAQGWSGPGWEWLERNGYDPGDV